MGHAMLDKPRPSLARQLFTNQVWETIAFFAKAVFTVGLTPWMIRIWGTNGYGEFALGSSTFVLLSLVDLGIRAKTRLALCSAGERDRTQWPGILAHSAVTFGVIGALTIAAAFVFTIAGLWQNLFHISVANRNLIFITTAMSILVMLSGLLLEPLVAIGHIGKLKLATASGWLAAIPGVTLVLAAKASVTAALVVWLGCLLGANLLILFRNRFVFAGAGALYRQLEIGRVMSILRESFWFNLCNATWTTKTYGTTLLISVLSGPAAAGFFFILLRLSEIIGALGAVSSDVSLGELAQASTPEQSRRSFSSSYSWAAVFCFHIALLIAFCTREFLYAWLHPATSMPILVGWVVAMLGLGSALNRTASYAAMGLGAAKSAAKYGAIEALAFLFLIVAMPHSLGLINRLAIATLSVFALLPLMRTVSRKLETSLTRSWLYPLRAVAPYAAANASILLIANLSENAVAKVFAIIICAGIGLLNICSQAGRPLAFVRRSPLPTLG
jgi:O-antigen/teichoic acid export membrane protein